MRLAYNTNGFAHHSLDDCLELLAELGYEGVSITLDVHHLDPFRTSPRAMSELSRRLDELGLARSIETGARFLLDPRRKHRPGLLDPEGWDRRLRFLERALEVATEIGATVVTFSSGALPSGVDEQEAFSRLAERCRALAELADRLGRVASFEPEPGFFVETLTQFGRLRDAVDHPSFGLTFDVGHAYLLESRPVADCLADSRADLRHVHIEDMRRPVHRHLALGEGAMPLEPIVRALDEMGFSGMAAVELSRDSHRAPEVAAEAIRRLRAMRSGRA